MIPWLIVVGLTMGTVGVLARGRILPLLLTMTSAGLFVGALLNLQAPFHTWQTTYLHVSSLHLVLGVQSTALSNWMGLTTTFVALMAQIYALGYLSDDSRLANFQSIILAFTSTMMLTAWGNNLLTQFIGWELMGIGSYLLVGFFRQTQTARYAASKSLLITHIGDLGFLVALLSAVSANSSAIADVNAHGSAWIAWGLIVAVAAKSAQGPFASWLLDAMAGPTPASALIHAATMVAAGPYLLIRYFPLLSHTPGALLAIAILGGSTAVFAALGALGSQDIKRLLAHSTLSQLGIMLFALGIGAPQVAWMFLLAHAAYKALLFFIAGIASHRVHSGQLDHMSRSLTTIERGFALGLGVLALAGWPPTGGFVAKVLLFHAASTHSTFMVTVDLTITALSGAYAGRLWAAFRGPARPYARPTWPMMLPVALLATVVVETMVYHPLVNTLAPLAPMPIGVSLAVAALGAAFGYRWHRPYAIWTGAIWQFLWSALFRAMTLVGLSERGVIEGVTTVVAIIRTITRLLAWPISGQPKRYLIVSSIFISVLVVWTFH